MVNGCFDVSYSPSSRSQQYQVTRIEQIPYTMAKIVVLISGSGSNLQALIDASTKEPKKLDADIVKVISSSPDAYGLARAAHAKIPIQVHQLKEYYKGIPKDSKEERKVARDQFDSDLAQVVIAEEPDLVVCAGWMLILSMAFLEPLSQVGIPIINLHPALPGTFEGTHAIERSWEAGRKGEITKGGCMVHYVIEAVDMGEPLVVKELEVTQGESVDAWEKKIHDLEHVAIVEGAQLALEKSREEAEAKASQAAKEKEEAEKAQKAKEAKAKALADSKKAETAKKSPIAKKDKKRDKKKSFCVVC